METQELDVALDELESRLDRLRSLYEQYFLGIEKIEPTVARKDVDRRFWILRRVKIRNTARRFRMQVLIQRYNTFQQYWLRICREIENGTYVRHLLRVQKKLGDEPMTWAAKKRLGLFRKDRAAANASEATAARSDMGELLDGGGDLAAEAERAAALAVANADRQESARAPAHAAPVKSPRGPFTLEDLGPLDLDFDDEPPPPPPKQVAVTAPKAVVPAPAPAAAPKPVAPQAQPANGTPKGVAPALAPRLPMPSAVKSPDARAVERPVTPASPAARPAVPSPPAAPAGAPARPGTNGGASLSDERVRTLHAELVAAKRGLNQADAVSVDSLARTLRETEKKLRAQHQGRNVDFQIVVKDGKPIVKPIVRK